MSSETLALGSFLVPPAVLGLSAWVPTIPVLGKAWPALVAAPVAVKAGAGLAWLAAMKYLKAGGSYNTKNTDLTGKVIIVTGSNTGIGKETAGILAACGATVVMACRDPKRASGAVKDIQANYKLKNGNAVTVVPLTLDLGSLASVNAFAREFTAKYDRLDILINNAGVMMTPEQKTADGFEKQVGTNHIGHTYLTQLLLPLLRRTKGRIVNVSSLGHNFAPKNATAESILSPTADAYSPVVAYGKSKLGNVLHARALNNLYGSDIQAYSVHPGGVNTELTREFNIVARALVQPIALLLFKTSWEGAQTSITCALDPKAKPGYYLDCRPGTTSALGSNDRLAGQLHEQTLAAIQKAGFALTV